MRGGGGIENFQGGELGSCKECVKLKTGEGRKGSKQKKKNVLWWGGFQP